MSRLKPVPARWPEKVEWKAQLHQQRQIAGDNDEPDGDGDCHAALRKVEEWLTATGTGGSVSGPVAVSAAIAGTSADWK
jgi:hypothetical protein